MFNYKNTCKYIDAGIGEIQNKIAPPILEMVENNPDLHNKTELVDEVSDKIFNDIEELFEAVRQTNVEMRKEAETQLETLKGEYDLEIDNLNETIAILEAELEHLKSKED
jgi:SMC interacting uncharacterized protein involved in chromosome segregation